jgi:hypothetical protein
VLSVAEAARAVLAKLPPARPWLAGIECNSTN